jgi:hypothetical protein
MRLELNKLDAMGFDNPAAQGMVESLRNMPLPERVTHSGPYNPHALPQSSHLDHLRTSASSFSGPSANNFPDLGFESNFDFPFNPAFDAHKISAPTKNQKKKYRDEFSFNSVESKDNSNNNNYDSKDIYEQKPHLYTYDPYENEPSYSPDPEPYHPTSAYHEPEPYHPPTSYHEPEPYQPPTSYHEPEPYHPPTSYHEPEPYHPTTSYHEPEPYHPTSAYHEPEPYHPPTSYHEPEP